MASNCISLPEELKNYDHPSRCWWGLGLVPAGLGSRDSLRLEVGYALYGNDLDEEHTTLESGLGWVTKLDKEYFIGQEALASQKKGGVTRRLVGLRLTGKGFPRPGYEVIANGEVVGKVTSGTVSPTLGYGVALAYVPAELSKVDTELKVNLQGPACGRGCASAPVLYRGLHQALRFP